MSQQILQTPSTHAFSLISALDHATNVAKDGVVSLAGVPLAHFCEITAISILKKVKIGHLRVLTSSNIYTFPEQLTPCVSTGIVDGPSLPSAEIRVLKDSFWPRLVLMSDLGFAEAYMYGEVEADCEDLIQLFKIFMYNRKHLAPLEHSLASFIFSLPQKLTSYRFLNTISNSRSNISAHYDISNRMFEAFLSKDMMYSCALFPGLDGDLKLSGVHVDKSVVLNGIRPSPQGIITGGKRFSGKVHADELHEAQLRKIRHIIRKANIRPGHRVLEIGTGWGALAILAVQETGCIVDTITLSSHQKDFAEERIAEAGLSDKIRVHLLDYRNLPSSWEGAFDRVISIEMIEAVGAEFLETYWKVVNWALHPTTGVGVIQVITIPEARYDKYITEIDFIRKWIFPGGFLPTVTLLLQSMKEGSQSRLVVDSINNIGPHYARTLREWRRRFEDAFDGPITDALKEEHPELLRGSTGAAEIEVFKRKWLYYFCYCEAGFLMRVLGVHIVTFAREGDESFGCALTSSFGGCEVSYK